MENSQTEIDSSHFNNSQSHSISNPNLFPVITSPKTANTIIDHILQNGPTVIGVDIEAAVEMSRFGIPCLLQLFSSSNIVKVFHDCIEDISLLYNLCNIKEMKSIFDTQIAHRMCFEEHNYNASMNGNKNASISLAALYKQYLNIEYELKGEMHSLMTKNPYLWKTRPLSDKLNFYAGNDVLYLPKIFEIICMKLSRKNNVHNHGQYGHKKRMISNLNIDNIFNECKKYLAYVKINLNIKNFHKTNIPQNTVLQGLIKNYQHHCVFIQLNIGYIGIVVNYKTVDLLKKKYSLGDIVMFKVVELDQNKKRYVLDICNTPLHGEENTKESVNNAKLATNLNVCEKSFYPRSYLQLVEGKNNENSYMNNNTNDDYEKSMSLYDLLNNNINYTSMNNSNKIENNSYSKK